MPSDKTSLVSQLNTAEQLKADDNYIPVPLSETFDLRVDGSGTAVTREFNQWTELDGDPNPASPIKTISAIEFVAVVADDALNLTEFLGGAALSTGIPISIRLNGVTVTIGTITKMTDLYRIFDEVIITTDSETTPNNVIKARKLYAEENGTFLQLVDETSGDEDAILATVSENLSAVGAEISLVVHGFGYVGRR